MDLLRNKIIKYQTSLLVGYVLRYDKAANHLKKILHDEKYGEILSARIECGSYLPNWRPSTNYKDTVSAKKLGGGFIRIKS